MLLPIEWSEEAQFDLAEIQFYIEQFNHVAALNLRQTIEQGVERFLPSMPFGFRSGRVKGTREYVVHPNYIVVYRVEFNCVKVLRILHARQEYP